jgi:hypothetical protein
VITADLLKQLRITEAPKPRYDDLPEQVDQNDQIEKFVNYRKALELIDPLLTARFTRFIPDDIEIDQKLDARQYRHGMMFCPMVRTDVKPPVNSLITKTTGVTPSLDMDNMMRYVAVELRRQYSVVGALKMAPPLVFSTRGSKSKRIPALLGVICKFDTTPPDALTQEDIVAAEGVMIPPTKS